MYPALATYCYKIQTCLRIIIPFQTNTSAMVYVGIVRHVLIFYGKIPRKYWVSIDYIWVGLAIIGLIAKTTEIRKKQLQSDVESHAQDLAGVYMRALEQSAYLENNFERTSPLLGHQFKSLKDSIMHRHDDILVAFDTTISKRIFEFNKKITSDSSKMMDMKKPLDMELGVLNETISHIQEDRRNAKETPFEKTLFAITPYLLAIAIALRLSKVSFDLKNLP